MKIRSSDGAVDSKYVSLHPLFSGKYKDFD